MKHNLEFRARPYLPVKPEDLPPMQRGSQVPATLHLPSPEFRELFKRLGRHLNDTNLQKLKCVPIGLTIVRTEFACEIQLHISPDLTCDQRVYREVHDAIAGFLERACHIPFHSEFTGTQYSGGIGVFKIPMDKALAMPESIDLALVAVTRIARFVQVVDGNVDRLAVLLRDPDRDEAS